MAKMLHSDFTTKGGGPQGLCGDCKGGKCLVADWIEGAQTWEDICAAGRLYWEVCDKVMLSAEAEAQIAEIDREITVYRQTHKYVSRALLDRRAAIPYLDCGATVMAALRAAWAGYVVRRGLSLKMARDWTEAIAPDGLAHVHPRTFFDNSRTFTEEHRGAHGEIYLWPTTEQAEDAADLIHRGLPLSFVPTGPDARYTALIERRYLNFQEPGATLPVWADEWIGRWNLDGRHTRQACLT